MLLRVNIENYLSFDEKVEFSLIANQKRELPSHIRKFDKINLLKTGIIYGANASGKSNFVKALLFTKNIITNGLDKTFTSNLHFRLNSENIHKPSIFNFEIQVNNKFYSYGFAIILSQNKIVEEWLYDIKKDDRIFERFFENNIHNIEIGSKIYSKAKKRFDVYKEDFKNSDTLLFLSEIIRKNLQDFPEAIDFKNVYDWFNEKLVIILPDSKFALLNFIPDIKALSETFSVFLNHFQTGINDITSNEIDFDKFEISQEIKSDLIKKTKDNNFILFQINGIYYNLYKTKDNLIKINKIGLKHTTENGDEVTFDLENESDGTRRLLDFIPAINDMINSDNVFIIDELDRSLHSKITYDFIELFIGLTKNNNSQLIATTHESLLLDLNLLRRDEIWFIEKENSASKMYCLDEFEVRNDKIIRKDYLLGRYGAIPLLKSFNPKNS